MDKTDSESISDLISECQALVNEQVKLEDEKERNEKLLEFMLKDDQSEITRNKLKIQNFLCKFFKINFRYFSNVS